MNDSNLPVLKEYIPKQGLVYSEKGNLTEVLCKPKILPIKSATLLKIEKMEQDAAKQLAPTTNAGAPPRLATSK